jgi:hypothetical protein
MGHGYMVRLNYFFILLAGKFLIFSQAVFGQCTEQILLATDRDIYFSGEPVWYSLHCLKTGSGQHSTMSKVAYMELLNTRNIPVAQFKLFLKEGQNNSRIIIPDTLSTGDYMIVTYTNWMKNFGYKVFSTKIISVINPFQKNTFAKVDKLFTRNPRSAGLFKPAQLSVQSIKPEYNTRSLVELNLQNTESLSDVSVSVVKPTLISKKSDSSERIEVFKSENILKKADETSFRMDFLPELEGEIISGTIRNKNDNTFLINQVLTLGFVGQVPLLYLSKTDSLGRFRFVVNQFGPQDMVIQPLSRDTTNMGFLIDLSPVFVSAGERIQSMDNPVDETFIEEINKCIINMQIEAVYNSISGKQNLQEPALKNYCFYGEPEIKVALDKYIELPTMNEVFKEIVPNVAVRDKKNQNTFKVVGTVGGTIKNSFTMVDGICIKDINKIMAINPEDIKQIEVINLTYYLQDQELGAIISIQTKKGDLSAIIFDNRIFRQEFQTYDLSRNFSGPDYSIDSVYSSPVADFRNLLYWNPDVKLDKKGSGVIKFYTSDDSGKYMIIFEGINKNGERERLEVPFSVSN